MEDKHTLEEYIGQECCLTSMSSEAEWVQQANDLWSFQYIYRGLRDGVYSVIRITTQVPLNIVEERIMFFPQQTTLISFEMSGTKAIREWQES